MVPTYEIFNSFDKVYLGILTVVIVSNHNILVQCHLLKASKSHDVWLNSLHKYFRIQVRYCDHLMIISYFITITKTFYINNNFSNSF